MSLLQRISSGASFLQVVLLLDEQEASSIKMSRQCHLGSMQTLSMLLQNFVLFASILDIVKTPRLCCSPICLITSEEAGLDNIKISAFQW